VRIRLAKGLLVMALTLSLGAQWAFLQSVAWTGMLYTYGKEFGLSKAVSMTFDGKHPCGLCRAIEKGKSDQRQQQKKCVTPTSELKLQLPPAPFALFHPPHPSVTVTVCNLRIEPGRPPELPPPRPL
jgi:hypothetical protein